MVTDTCDEYVQNFGIKIMPYNFWTWSYQIPFPDELSIHHSMDSICVYDKCD